MSKHTGITDTVGTSAAWDQRPPWTCSPTFLPHSVHQLSVPMLDMVSLTAEHLSEGQPPIPRAGLLTGGAIYVSELYQQRCEPLGIKILTRDQGGQEAVAASMREVKGGCTSSRTKARLVMVAEELVAQGAESVILACTELRLILQQEDQAVPVIDPIPILADAVVERAFP